MFTCDLEGLSQLLDGLSVANPTLDVIEADVLANPLDICRATLAGILSTIVGIDREEAYKSIQWPNNIFNGDLSVTLPRLRPGCKSSDLSSELVNEVRVATTSPSVLTEQ
jgi:arginyl-tRNA synthetase